jgi:hypothetical protein
LIELHPDAQERDTLIENQAVKGERLIPNNIPGSIGLFVGITRAS